MKNNKKLIDFFRSEGLLFPTTEEEVEKFEQLSLELDKEPSDWDDPTQIIKRGRQNLKHLNMEKNTSLKSEIQDLKMVARKGNKLPKEILERMKKNQKINEKGK